MHSNTGRKSAPKHHDLHITGQRAGATQASDDDADEIKLP